MVYVDDLLFVGEPSEVNKIFEEIQKHLLLRETGIAHHGKTISFLGRKITHQGSRIDITLGDSYVQNILEESELTKCNPAPTPGSSATKTTIKDQKLLDTDQHRTLNVQTIGRQASMASLHQARHGLQHQRTSKINTATQHQRSKETQTRHQIPCRHNNIQVQHSTHHQTQNARLDTNRSQHLC